jgi:GT2 family glycosyltransferase
MLSCKVGVVTVTYNSTKVLPDFLRSLWHQAHSNFILYAIDNVSQDATVAELREETDTRLRIVKSSSNVGIAEGNNIGIRMALQDGCDAVLLLNNDVVFPPDLISTLTDSLDAHQSDMAAPKMMYYGLSNKIWWAGGHFQRALGYRMVHRGLDQVDVGQYDLPIRTTFAPACCVLIRSKVFTRIGLMDPKYFFYYDDTDFMLRAWRAGVSLVYDPRVSLYHKVSSLTGGSSSPLAVRLLARNRVYYWLKHVGLVRTLFYTASLVGLYLLSFLLFRKPLSMLKVQLPAFAEGFTLGHTPSHEC